MLYINNGVMFEIFEGLELGNFWQFAFSVFAVRDPVALLEIAGNKVVTLRENEHSYKDNEPQQYSSFSMFGMLNCLVEKMKP